MSHPATPLVVSLLLPALLTEAVHAQDPLFGDPLLPLGQGRSQAVDLDGDGTLDLIHRGGDSSQGIGVSLGLGGGSFAAAVFEPAAFPVGGFALGDIDADGLLDVCATTLFGAGDLALYRSSAPGVLAAPLAHPTPIEANALALFDHDEDGQLDLLTGGVLQYALHDGVAGLGFGATSTLDAGFIVADMTAADMDADGDTDVLSCGGGSTLGFVINQPGSNLHIGFNAGVSPSPGDLATGDLNGDGQLEAVSSSTSTEFTITTWVNGVPQHTQVDTSPLQARTVAVADVNGDGLDDVAIHGGNSAPHDLVALYLADGSGGVVAGAQYAADHGSFVQFADLDDDQHPDLCVTTRSGLRILWGQGGGQFEAVVPTSYVGGPSQNTKGVASGDLNGDGWQDLLAAQYSSFLAPTRVWLSDGLGGYAEGADYDNDGNAYWVGTADFNLDGVLDVVTLIEAGGSEMNNVALRLGQGDGSLGASSLHATGVFPNHGVIDDLDLDGDYDLAVSFFGGSNPSGVSVLLGQGAQGFAPKVDHAVPTLAGTIDSVDLSGDGLPELVAGRIHLTSGSSSAIPVLANQGGGLFATGAPIELPENVWRIEFADVDADGDDDLLATTNEILGRLMVYTSDGSGQFSTHASFQPASAEPRVPFAGDFDGDGRIEIGATNSGTLSLYRSLPGGGYAPEQLSAAANHGALPQVGDLNHDGRLDLLFGEDGITSSGTLAIKLNQLGTPSGVQPVGSGTPSCAGRQGVSASLTPSVGESEFALLCTNAPARASGFLLLGGAGSASGTDPAGLGLLLHVDPLSAPFELYPMTSGADGSSRALLPVPDNAALAGTSLALQTVWIEPVGPGCSASWLPLSSSRGLAVTLAP